MIQQKMSFLENLGSLKLVFKTLSMIDQMSIPGKDGNLSNKISEQGYLINLIFDQYQAILTLLFIPYPEPTCFTTCFQRTFLWNWICLKIFFMMPCLLCQKQTLMSSLFYLQCKQAKYQIINFMLNYYLQAPCLQKYKCLTFILLIHINNQNLKRQDSNMFYIVQNLKSQLVFSPYDMDKLSSDEQIIKRLKSRVEGRCHAQYGYIVQLFNSGGGDASFVIDVPSVQETGCKVGITYSAITFKGKIWVIVLAEKKDIIDIIVTQIQEEFIKGKIGHADVLIPQAKIDSSCQYKKVQNIYMIENDSISYRIERGSKVRCKCFDIKIQMNFQMKIMAQIDRNIINNFPYN